MIQQPWAPCLNAWHSCLRGSTVEEGRLQAAVKSGEERAFMARYDGMDEILQRLRERASQSRPLVESKQPMPPVREKPARDLAYTRAGEQLVLLLHEAEELHSLLLTERTHAITQVEHDDLLAMLGKAQRELGNCETALQRVAPYD